MGIFKNKNKEITDFLEDNENSYSIDEQEGISILIKPVQSPPKSTSNVDGVIENKAILKSGFFIEIENKSTKNIEIDWNKTQFFDNGYIKGHFSLVTSLYIDREQNIRNQPIPSNTKFNTVIYPWHCRDSAGNFKPLPFGNIGVCLYIKSANTEHVSKIYIKNEQNER